MTSASNALLKEPSTSASPTPLSELSPAGGVPAQPVPGPAKSSSMGLIFLLVGAAIVIFMAFTIYSVHKEIQGRAQLTAIKERYFPLLQRLDANIVRLDKIQELYVQVVITGDKATINKATHLGDEADQAFAEILKLYPGHENEISRLRSDLQQYQQLATKASLAFLSQDRETAAPIAANMNKALAAVGARLKAFRQSGYDEFVQTLAASQQDAQRRLLLGLALGLMNLGFMAVLVYFIRNNLKMMTLIEEQNATLERRVTERTAQLSQKTFDINAMLQNMKLGVATVVPGNTIHPEYSSYLRTIFDIDDFAGKDLLETIFGRSNLGADLKDQTATALAASLGEDAFMYELNGHLLPREMQLDEPSRAQKIVQMEWSPIINAGNTVEKVLLITQDVTQLRELEASAAQQKEELETISKIIRVPIGKFNEFVESTSGFIVANRRLLQEARGRSVEVTSALFRNMHTIKGNARTFEFTHVTNAAHAAEQSYDRQRKDADAEWDAEQMLAELHAVETALRHLMSVNEHKLGRKGRASDLFTTRGAFVSENQLSELRSMVAELTAGRQAPSAAQACLSRLQNQIGKLGLIAWPRLVSGVVDSLASLAEELKKPAPEVEIEDQEVAFNSRFAEALKACCLHIVRNALDHGIEAPAERARAGKPERGRIRFVCARPAEKVQLRISDDGRGLDLASIHAKAVAASLVGADEPLTREQVADLIFRSGLSTAAELSQLSGRGVGMDAVRAFMNEQGANVRAELQDPSSTDLGLTPFALVIDIPAAACSH